MFVADAHRGDGKRFVVRADEKLTAFVELESTARTVPILLQADARLTGVPANPRSQVSVVLATVQCAPRHHFVVSGLVEPLKAPDVAYFATVLRRRSLRCGWRGAHSPVHLHHCQEIDHIMDSVHLEE